MELDDSLAEICSRHFLDASFGATIPEPYIPLIPPRWNGALVVAEAQNHGVGSSGYLERLKAMTVAARIRRLSSREQVDIQPWDDGSLKLAVVAAFDVDPRDTAVSNAVLWSQVDSQGRNVTPSDTLIERSMLVWSELLPALNPKYIITAGTLADKVIGGALGQCDNMPRRVKLRLPSPMALSRVSGMFDVADLLDRYPEVRAAADAHSDWVASHRKNKIFFACHAVSIATTIAAPFVAGPDSSRPGGERR
jgi:hypothetical protein